MNHPGIYISLFFWAVLIGGTALVHTLQDRGLSAGGYVCPPCGCSYHEAVMDSPGFCRGCGMPLITAQRPRNKVMEAIFVSSEPTFYHHKFFYPVNFLALFIGFFSLYRFRRELPMRLFFVFFLSLVLYSFKNQLYGTEYSMHASKDWAFFPISFLLATGPALYLYSFKTLNLDNRFSRKDWLHFLPAAVVFLTHAICFWGPERWREAAFYNNYDHYPGLAEQLCFLGSGAYYVFLNSKMARRNQSQEYLLFRWQRWLRQFMTVLLLGLALMLGGNFFYFDGMSTWLDYHPVWLLIALFTLWCTYMLVFKKEVIFQKGVPRENRLTDEKIQALKAVLENVMQTQKPYLEPELTLQSLAQMVGIKEKDLSEVLNSGFSRSFHDYVNLYRIEAVKELLLMPEKQHLTNLAMAQEAGFNSKSAFFGLFKKYVGMTPGMYKQRHGQG